MSRNNDEPNRGGEERSGTSVVCGLAARVPPLSTAGDSGSDVASALGVTRRHEGVWVTRRREGEAPRHLVQRPGRPSALHHTRVVVRAVHRSMVRDHDARAGSCRPTSARTSARSWGRTAPQLRAIRLFRTRRPSRMPTLTPCSPPPFVRSHPFVPSPSVGEHQHVCVMICAVECSVLVAERSAADHAHLRAGADEQGRRAARRAPQAQHRPKHCRGRIAGAQRGV
jgi:hypothetical protein